MSEHEHEAGAPERDAVDEVAGSRDADATQQATALAYFMGDAPAPGSDRRFELLVDFGPLGEPNWQTCTFRQLAAEELDRIDDLSRRSPKEGEPPAIDFFFRWSFIFAYACLDPDLGAARQARNAQGGKFTDTAALVREVFRFTPGVLRSAANEVERRTRLGEDPDRAVREVEAGKTSS